MKRIPSNFLIKNWNSLCAVKCAHDIQVIAFYTMPLSGEAMHVFHLCGVGKPCMSSIYVVCVCVCVMCVCACVCVCMFASHTSSLNAIQVGGGYQSDCTASMEKVNKDWAGLGWAGLGCKVNPYTHPHTHTHAHTQAHSTRICMRTCVRMYMVSVCTYMYIYVRGMCSCIVLYTTMLQW